MHALFLEPDLWSSNQISGGEFTHASKVIRMRKGEEFLLFDGQGKKALCRLEDYEKKHLTFSILEEEIISRPKHNIILAAAWTKAARRGFLLEKAVELEAKALWIWKSQYSQFPLPDEDSATTESFQAQLIAGLKQCQNPYLPELKLIQSQKDLIKAAATLEHKQVLTTDPAPNILPYTFDVLKTQGETLVIIGPEGGFSPEEIKIFAEQNYRFYTLGERILRYETAAILALGLHFWQSNVGLN